MYGYKRSTEKYREAEEKNIFITDTEGRLLYQSPRTEYDLGMLLDKIKKISENFEEQEVLDKKNRIYVNIRKTVIECDGEAFYCYHMTDISEYAMLIHEVSGYTNSVTNMSRFQSSIRKIYGA